MKIYYIFISSLITKVLADSISFVAIGDWGGDESYPYTTEAQKKVSQAMNDVATKLDSKFVLALGDNFYYHGVTADDSMRFEATWDQVYDGEALQTPWYVIGGNHDHLGNITAQVSYSSTSDRWKFPSLFHNHSFTSSDGNDAFTLDIIMIDTVSLSGVSSYDADHPKYFDALPLLSRDHDIQSWMWIESQLSSSTADYLLVMGHYPMYSVCQHGNTELLIKELLPMLEQHDAHYVAGHDHCMEHIQPPGSSVNHYLVGMGMECCYKPSNINLIPADSLSWYIASDNHDQVSGGFASFTATDTSLIATFYDQDGNVLYQAPEIKPRGDMIKNKK